MNGHGNGSGGGVFARAFLHIALVAATLGALAAPALGVTIGTLADSNGQIAAWGQNNWGQCNVPPWSYIGIGAGGDGHNTALRSDGTLAAWGNNSLGQCDAPAGTYVAVASGASHSLALRADGAMVAWGWNDRGPCNVPPGTYIALAAGHFHSLGIRSDGSIACWGWNAYGALNGIPPASETFTAVAGGGAHSVAIRPDGTLAAWGNNTAGQCNVPAGTFTDVAGGHLYSLAIRTDGTLAAWGENNFGQCDVPVGTFTDIAGGEHHGLALRSDGTLAAWGQNEAGCLDVPAGIFVAITGLNWYHMALRARTDYDSDLLVGGTGVGANLNRSITVAGDATISSTMYCYNNPTMTVGGTTTITPTGAIQGAATINGRVVNEGLVNGALGVILNGPVSGTGNYAGHVTFNGGFSPGTSPASVTGDWIIFGAGNTLTMELGGIVQGTEYDHITANQLLTLAGTLDVLLINGFNPENHDRFDLLDGPMEGQFSALNLPDLDEGLMWFTDRLYSEGVLSVGTPEPATLTLLALGGLGLAARRRKRQAPNQVK